MELNVNYFFQGFFSPSLNDFIYKLESFIIFSAPNKFPICTSVISLAEKTEFLTSAHHSIFLKIIMQHLESETQPSLIASVVE